MDSRIPSLLLTFNTLQSLNLQSVVFYQNLDLSVSTMGLDILEPYTGDAPAHVSGTATLLHDNDGKVQDTSNSAITSVPGPSKSPRDPSMGAQKECRTVFGAYAEVELAIVEERPCRACNLLSITVEGIQEVLALDCE